MKKISGFFLLVCLGVIIYFFIKEQFNGITLTHNENLLLSVAYLITGLSVFMMARSHAAEKKGE